MANAAISEAIASVNASKAAARAVKNPKETRLATEIIAATSTAPNAANASAAKKEPDATTKAASHAPPETSANGAAKATGVTTAALDAAVAMAVDGLLSHDIAALAASTNGIHA